MVEKIKMIKDQVLEFMGQEVGKYGGTRMDVKELGELADIVKDLAAAEESCWEAEYYYTVTEAMQHSSGSSGYANPTYSRTGYSGGINRQGYSGGMMGHSDPMNTIREILSTADPEMRMKIRNEIVGM